MKIDLRIMNITPRRAECLCGAVLVEGVGEPVIGTCKLCQEIERLKQRKAEQVMQLKKRKVKTAGKLTPAEEQALFRRLSEGE